MNVVWSDRARRDLLEIGRFIARDNPSAAKRWTEVLRQKARQVAEHPLAGRQVPEIGREEIREVLHRNYRIVYLLDEKRIVVLTVFEGHRRFPSLPDRPDQSQR